MKTSMLTTAPWRILILLLASGLWVGMALASEGGGVTERYKSARAAFDASKVPVVIDLPAKTVRVKERYQGGAFWIESRKDKIERYKCSQCHNKKPVSANNAAAVAHGDIRLIHGGREKPLSCFTCHNREDRDLLVTEAGESVDLDHSYQMCGQCHFRQKKDWVGGAHGKRMGYWAGKRVVQSCTSCHDPHSPRFEKRWPVIYSPPIVK